MFDWVKLILSFLKSILSGGDVTVRDNFKRENSHNIKIGGDANHSKIGNTENCGNTLTKNYYGEDELTKANKARKDLTQHLQKSFDGHSTLKYYENWIAMLLHDPQFSKEINISFQNEKLQNQFVESLTSFIYYSIIKGIENGKQSFQKDWNNFIEQHKKIIPANKFNAYLFLINEAINYLKEDRIICYLNLDASKKELLIDYLIQSYDDLQIKLSSNKFQPA